MTAHFAPPAAIDLLALAVDHVRPMLLEGTTKQRIRVLWAAAKNARDLGASDVVFDSFMALAVEVGMIDARGRWTGDDVRTTERRYGAQDVSHAIVWALCNRNPFEGPQQ